MNTGVFIVIPIFDESQTLHDVIMPLLASGYNVVAVDDGSSDDTWSVLQTLPVVAVKHVINLGQGAALQTGTEVALSLGAQYIVHFDADAQHRPSDIGGMLDILRNSEADIVLGSRFLRKQDIQAVPRGRRMLLRAAVLVNTILTGVKLTDAHNGMRALTANTAKKFKIQESGYAHASEILMLIKKHGLRYYESPTHILYSSVSAKKGQSGWNAINIFFDVILKKLFD